ncbi:hypothetical protein BC831DRAFT_449349 [Entophlyctis helioformis]|nr:hypothetical protein BC831DRAFT_449349 [Entophlyctis helioformis]
MGCGASKEVTVETTAAPPVAPPAAEPAAAPAKSAGIDHTAETLKATQIGVPTPTVSVTAGKYAEDKDKAAELAAKSALSASDGLSKPVIPSIPSDAPKVEAGSGEDAGPVSVAFEIPLDNLTAVRKSLTDASAPLPAVGKSVHASATKLSLPKLHLSDKDLQEKLANTEARWKDLEDESDNRRRRKGDKPQLVSRNKEADPESLKRRLLEKEAAAALNRQREIEKLQAKLARQEEHARRVQERKRALGGGGSNEDLRLSWGGEKGLAEGVLGSGNSISGSGSGAGNGAANEESGNPSSKGSGVSSADHAGSSADSSAADLFANANNSRGGSGRSTNTDTTDVGEDASQASNSPPQPTKNAAAATTGAAEGGKVSASILKATTATSLISPALVPL